MLEYCWIIFFSFLNTINQIKIYEKRKTKTENYTFWNFVLGAINHLDLLKRGLRSVSLGPSPFLLLSSIFLVEAIRDMTRGWRSWVLNLLFILIDWLLVFAFIFVSLLLQLSTEWPITWQKQLKRVIFHKPLQQKKEAKFSLSTRISLCSFPVRSMSTKMRA